MAYNKWSTALIPPQSLMNTTVSHFNNNYGSSVTEERAQPATKPSPSSQLSVREQMLWQLQMREKVGVRDLGPGDAGGKENTVVDQREAFGGENGDNRESTVTDETLFQLPLKLQMLLQLQEKEGLAHAVHSIPSASNQDLARRAETLRYPKAETIKLLKLRRTQALAGKKDETLKDSNSPFPRVTEPAKSGDAQSSRSPTSVARDATQQPSVKPDLRQNHSFDALGNHCKAGPFRPRLRSNESAAAASEDTNRRLQRNRSSYEVPPRFRKPPEAGNSDLVGTVPGTIQVVVAQTVEEEEVDIDALLLNPRESGSGQTPSPGIAVSLGTIATSPVVPGTGQEWAARHSGNLSGTPGHFPSSFTFQEAAKFHTAVFPGIPGCPGRYVSQQGSIASLRGAAGTKSVSPASPAAMSTGGGTSPGNLVTPGIAGFHTPDIVSSPGTTGAFSRTAPGTSGLHWENTASSPGVITAAQGNPGSPLAVAGTRFGTSPLSPGTTAALTGLPLLAGTQNLVPGPRATPPNMAGSSPVFRTTSPGIMAPVPAHVPGTLANTDLLTLQAVNALKQEYAAMNLHKQQLQQLQREQVIILLLQQESKHHKNVDLVKMLTFLSQQPFKPSVPFINQQLLSIVLNSVCVQRSLTLVEEFAAQRLAQLAESERSLFHA